MLFAACPEVYFIPRIKLNPPYDWQRAHPEELYLYEEGAGLSAEEIAGMVDTVYQDSTGSVSKPGLKEGKKVRPNLGHQSFASEIWRKDAGDALRRLIDYLEASPYADRILGYHIAYGKCGETHFWGNDELKCDFSKPNRRAFYAFGVKKYGSAEALEQAWGVKISTPEECPVPNYAMNRGEAADLEEFFHNRESDRLYVDHQEYRRELSHEVLHGFAHIAKEMTGKAVGSFHGYILSVGANHHGHTDLQLVMDDPDVDFIAAPKSYYRTGYGEPGGSYCVTQSVNRKMLWVEELDNRTHRAMPKILSATENCEQTKWVMWREFSRNEMTGSSYWWMDLGDGWYDDPELLAEIGKIYEKKQKLAKMEKQSIAEILAVMDERTYLHITQHKDLHFRMLQDTLCELAYSGAPYDLYRQEDLGEIDLSRYKLVVFLNPFEISAEEFAKYSFAPGTRFVWNYLPGGNLSEAEKLTGLPLRESGKNDGFPYLEILPGEGVTEYRRYGDAEEDRGKMPEIWDALKEGTDGVPVGKVSTAGKGMHTVCALPAPDRRLLRALGEEAGCRFYAPVGSIVYGDSRFLGIFDQKDFRILSFSCDGSLDFSE